MEGEARYVVVQWDRWVEEGSRPYQTIRVRMAVEWHSTQTVETAIMAL